MSTPEAAGGQSSEEQKESRGANVLRRLGLKLLIGQTVVFEGEVVPVEDFPDICERHSEKAKKYFAVYEHADPEQNPELFKMVETFIGNTALNWVGITREGYAQLEAEQAQAAGEPQAGSQ